jgi:hypothetical protein
VDAMGEARPTDDPPTIDLYSDGRIQDLAEHVLRGETLTSRGLTDADNVAISAVSVERPFGSAPAVQCSWHCSISTHRCQMRHAGFGDWQARGIQSVDAPGAVNGRISS